MNVASLQMKQVKRSTVRIDYGQEDQWARAYIHDLFFFERNVFFQCFASPIVSVQFDSDRRRRRHDLGQFVAIKISIGHMCHMCPGGTTPRVHAMRIFLRIFFDSIGNASIRIPFAQNWVHGRSHDVLIAFPDGFLFFRFGFHWIQRHIVPLGTQLRNAVRELIERSRNIRKLNDIAIWILSQITEIFQVVRNALVFFETFRKRRQDTSGQRNVARYDIDRRKC